VLYGHIADGNLHVNVATSPECAGHVRDAVLHVVQAHQGSLSAEHGIGRDKRDRLDWVRNTAEVAALRALKGALDPHGLLNPNAVLPSP
jgi:FAD/FMN-containing dehydrogenase